MGSNYQVRKNCRLCSADNLEMVIQLPPTVPGEHLKSRIEDANIGLVPIDLFQCGQCGHVQVVHIPPPEILWGSEYTFMPSHNSVLVEHFKQSVHYVTKNFLGEVKFALEIGSNDGLYLDELREATGCKVLGVDPSSAPVAVAREKGVETILDYFTPAIANQVLSEHGKPDVVIANNVFAHADDLRGIVDGLQRVVRDGGFLVFEASYLKDVMEKFLIGTIIHEHLSIHSVYSLNPFLREFGFSLVGVRHAENVQGGAIVGVAQKVSNRELPLEIRSLIEREIEAGVTTVEGMRLFQSRFREKADRLKKQILEKLGKKKIVGYGAARSAPLIIDILELRERIEYIIDDNPVKKGKYMGIEGRNIPIVGSDDHKSRDNDAAIVVLGWAQTERIIDNLHKAGHKGEIITIYPEFEILSV